MHLIAKGVKKRTGLPWLADFRDPWTNIDFAGDLKMSPFAKRRNEALESAVLKQADLITVVSDLMQEEFRSKTPKPVELRTELPGFSEKLCIRLIGKNDVSVRSSIEEFGLADITEWIDYIPHVQIIAEQKSAAVLLLAINNYGEAESKFFSPKATLTGKLFEYLASARPILMVGPTDAQAASVIKNCSAGEVVGFDDSVAMKQSLIKLFNDFSSRSAVETTNSIDQFSRISLTKNLVKCLNSIVKI
jgi:glycosyltransferase involved in cell wall biosynthesis